MAIKVNFQNGGHRHLGFFGSIGIGDGAKFKKKIFFGQLLCKFPAFFRQMSCEI